MANQQPLNLENISKVLYDSLNAYFPLLSVVLNQAILKDKPEFIIKYTVNGFRVGWPNSAEDYVKKAPMRLSECFRALKEWSMMTDYHRLGGVIEHLESRKPVAQLGGVSAFYWHYKDGVQTRVFYDA